MAVTSRPSHSTVDTRQAEPAPSQPAAPLAAFSGTRRVPPPTNEPIKGYAPGSSERAALKSRLVEMAGERAEMPIIIGGEDIHTGELLQSVMPHNHKHVLGDWHKASSKHVHQAVDAARTARADWGNWAWEDRAAVFLKAAE